MTAHPHWTEAPRDAEETRVQLAGAAGPGRSWPDLGPVVLLAGGGRKGDTARALADTANGHALRMAESSEHRRLPRAGWILAGIYFDAYQLQPESDA